VARNAATFPATLIDAELFGNVADYPNAGMPARAGVVGEAHNSTLFLDEIGELSRELQAHLLRVLDRGGEYQRLGDARMRQSDFGLVAATNRDPTELRLDILARLTLQVQLPSLTDRPEDIPLLVRHLLLEATRSAPALEARFVSETPGGPEPRVDPDLIELLLRHPFTYHVRELAGLLWKAVSTSPREYVALGRELRAEISVRPRLALPRAADDSELREPTAEQIMDCLTRNGSHVVRAARELGLSSRYALYRLMRKHDISVERTSDGSVSDALPPRGE
jgi:transcriptional regulator with PAS, ATPase and Fis domain